METSALYALLVGSVLVLAILSEAGLERLGFPDLLGYLALGVLLRELDHFWNVVPTSSTHVLSFLSEFGIIVLLFRVGLECNARSLFNRLPGATLIAAVNILVSGGLGFVAAHTLIGMPSFRASSLRWRSRRRALACRPASGANTGPFTAAKGR